MAKSCKILLPLPNRDFDPTEVSVPWKIITDAGHEIVFATPDGKPATADAMMLSGEGLDPWGFIPGLRRFKVIGKILRATDGARCNYKEMCGDHNFQNPVSYDDLSTGDFDGLLLPGGHAKGIKKYLESARLQELVVDFFESGTTVKNHKPVGAICHGVIVPARSISKKTGKSVLYGRKTTALTWRQEKSAWALTRYFARFWDPDYYRTYSEGPGDPKGYWSVESEVKRALHDDADFLTVPADSPDAECKLGIKRDSPEDERPAWVVRDGNYVSARWPGDVHSFSKHFVCVLNDVYGGTVA